MSQRFWLQQFGLVAVAAAFCLILTGCGSGKVTKENYEKLKEGQTEAEVKAVMGEPTENKPQSAVPAVKDEAGKEIQAEIKAGQKLMWVSGDKTIYVVLVDGKVSGSPKQVGLIPMGPTGK